MRPSIIRRSGVLASLRSGCHTFFFSSSIFPDAAAAADGQSCKPLSMAEYLVRSWGLSAAEASKVSKLSRGKSTQKADVVLNFLRSEGFEDSYIKKIVVLSPDFIVYDVKNNLGPKLRSFVDMGFSKSDTIEIIASNPFMLTLNLKRSILPKLEIWESLFGSRELLVKIVKKNRWCLRYSLEKRIFPNLKFLREELGISEDRVSQAARLHPGFIGQKPEALHALVDRADDLGMPRQSPMYLWALYILQTVSKENFKAKRDLFMSLGWSQTDFSEALRKSPSFLSLSVDELRKKMHFYVEEVGCTPPLIAKNPSLLGFSLKKRMIPRFRVVEMLKSKRLWTVKCKFTTLLTFSDKKFVEKFVIPYKEKVPEVVKILEGQEEILLALHSG
ncbi:transcription termination factor MTERF6, chloroplastic/mitochondrial-like [Zingiber officinale]|uniref:Uncharacterized protein n=1 Tax=Zingiber officinale TaxID=94328 RepID=A0A8J5FJI4_ZINOF|nr:transcription termination factor MTERF6, chloroplastic/mitochondrial-like [Zingiber officinale]KAG6488698.1 hypothetical protein ZIOFF_049947 [Zingiber officinale]